MTAYMQTNLQQKAFSFSLFQQFNSLMMSPRKLLMRRWTPFAEDKNKNSNTYNCVIIKEVLLIIFLVDTQATYLQFIKCPRCLLYHRITSCPLDCEMCPPTVTFLNQQDNMGQRAVVCVIGSPGNGFRNDYRSAYIDKKRQKAKWEEINYYYFHNLKNEMLM